MDLDQKSDDWQIGQAITNVYPNSHLAATVDESHGLLRLYFSSGNLTLQEVWLNITDSKSVYNNGKLGGRNDCFMPGRLTLSSLRLFYPQIPPSKQCGSGGHLFQ